ncbi:hypothetical protein Btru_048662 [Bulinus truncatus]|nr:hypothetical protein Btru_048662 [Bulinus truncatus]
MVQLAQFRQNMSEASKKFSARVDVMLEEQRELMEMKLKEGSLADLEQYQRINCRYTDHERAHSLSRHGDMLGPTDKLESAMTTNNFHWLSHFTAKYCVRRCP